MPPVTDADADTTVRIVIDPRWPGHQNIAAPPHHLAPAPVLLRSSGDANRPAQPVHGVHSFASWPLFLGFLILRVPAQALMIAFRHLLALFIYPV